MLMSVRCWRIAAMLLYAVIAVFAVCLHPTLADAASKVIHDYGAAATPATAPAYDLSNLPASRLNLTLSGTIAGAAADQRALISINGQADKSYSVGEAIIKGVVLVDVHKRYAIVHRSNAYEKLMLTGDGRSQQKDNPKQNDGLPPNPRAAAVDPAVEARLISEQRAHIPRKQFSFMGIQADVTDVVTQAKLILPRILGHSVKPHAVARMSRARDTQDASAGASDCNRLRYIQTHGPWPLVG